MEDKKLLIIDDDANYVESIKIMLKARGYTVDSASNGKEGLEEAKIFHPDLILLDVMMTTRSEGFDVSREFAKDEKLKSIPIILVTGIREEMNLPFGFEPDEKWIPVKAILEKPIIPERLLAEIEKHIK